MAMLSREPGGCLSATFRGVVFFSFSRLLTPRGRNKQQCSAYSLVVLAREGVVLVKHTCLVYRCEMPCSAVLLLQVEDDSSVTSTIRCFSFCVYLTTRILKGKESSANKKRPRKISTDAYLIVFFSPPEPPRCKSISTTCSSMACLRALTSAALKVVALAVQSCERFEQEDSNY